MNKILKPTFLPSLADKMSATDRSQEAFNSFLTGWYTAAISFSLFC